VVVVGNKPPKIEPRWIIIYLNPILQLQPPLSIHGLKPG